MLSKEAGRRRAGQRPDGGRRNLCAAATAPSSVSVQEAQLPMVPSQNNLTSSWHKHGGSPRAAPDLLMPCTARNVMTVCRFFFPACFWVVEWWGGEPGREQILEGGTCAVLLLSLAKPGTLHNCSFHHGSGVALGHPLCLGQLGKAPGGGMQRGLNSRGQTACLPPPLLSHCCGGRGLI